MSKRPEQVKSSDETSLHPLDMLSSENFSNVSNNNVSLPNHVPTSMQNVMQATGLSQDNIAMLSTASRLPREERCVRPRESLMDHLLSFASSFPAGSMNINPMNTSSVNSYQADPNRNSNLIDPLLQIHRNEFNPDISAGHGTDITDSEKLQLCVQQKMQQKIQQRQQHQQLQQQQLRKQQQQQLKLLCGNMDIMGSSNIVDTSQQVQSSNFSGLYPSLNSFPMHASSLCQLSKSSVPLSNQEPLPNNCSISSEFSQQQNGLSQQLHQMNRKIQLQQKELALCKSRIEKGFSDMNASLVSGLQPKEGRSIGTVSENESSKSVLHGIPIRSVTKKLSDSSQLTNTTASSELVFSNSSIAGIVPVSSRSTSMETTPNGKKVYYFPCRARGMDPGHTFETAYFTFLDGLDHGADLYCSYPACRAEGSKFRYCATCKAPAARRNFRKRHCHMKDDKSGTEGKLSLPNKNISEVSILPSKNISDVSILSEMSDTKVETGDEASVLQLPRISSESSKKRYLTTKKNPESSSLDGPYNDKGVLNESSKKQKVSAEEDFNQCFDDLLNSRPDVHDKSAMDSWMAKVVALNDRRIGQKGASSD